MKLPNTDDLIVEEEKIAGLPFESEASLWCSESSVLHDARVRLQEWNILADALREHGRSHEIKSSRETGFGPGYLVEGHLRTPRAIGTS